jgi:class 3 adenylate cyclase
LLFLAAGLPDPQPNHAIIMTRFARDCFKRLNQLLPDMADKLGPDTATLTFRVGLHSGGVTGGVLRGQKSRFQLFGDTMNTCARMESNGMAGRIHVSEETAEELRRHGKSHWLTEREDRIVAKGKGQMRTFYVSLSEEARSVATTSIGTLTRDQVPMSVASSDDDDCNHEVDEEPEISPANFKYSSAQHPIFDTDVDV